MQSIQKLCLILAATLLASFASAQGQTIQQYQFVMGNDGYELAMREVPRPVAGPNEILVEVRATSLNRRDVYMVEAPSGLDGTIPLSDGAGEVVAVGANVTEFAVGDRVVGTFFPEWVNGNMTVEGFSSARGGSPWGMLSEVIVTEPQGLLHIPEYMTYQEAASLPCAAVTAWNGLFKAGDLQSGDYVLLEGTGGVSTFGLQLAAAAGALPIITSSSDEKLAIAREMGAVGTANYRQNADWQIEVRELTNDYGVDHVLEIGGRDTLVKAMEAIAMGGHLAMIGGVSGQAPPLDIGSLVRTNASVTGIYVGSGQDFQNMLDFMTEHEIHPLIDREFSFDQAQEAYDFMNNGSYMGKIVITL